jgi:hypothetical protein
MFNTYASAAVSDVQCPTLAVLCCAGSRQLFLGDVQSGIKKFGALFFFLANVRHQQQGLTQIVCRFMANTCDEQYHLSRNAQTQPPTNAHKQQ